MRESFILSRPERIIVSQTGSKQAARKDDVWRPGVFMQGSSNQQRVWVQCVKIGGFEREIILGKFPHMSLADAREAALANREMIAAGVDVLSRRRRAKQQHLKSRLQEMTEQVDSGTAIRSFNTIGLLNRNKAQQSRDKASEEKPSGRRHGITFLKRKIMVWFTGYAQSPASDLVGTTPTLPTSPIFTNNDIDAAGSVVPLLEFSAYKIHDTHPAVGSSNLGKTFEGHALRDPIIVPAAINVGTSAKVAQQALERSGPNIQKLLKGLIRKTASLEQREEFIHHFSELLSKYGCANLDAACDGALMLKIVTLECVTSILESTDAADEIESTHSPIDTIAHANIRGAGYFN